MLARAHKRAHARAPFCAPICPQSAVPPRHQVVPAPSAASLQSSSDEPPPAAAAAPEGENQGEDDEEKAAPSLAERSSGGFGFATELSEHSGQHSTATARHIIYGSSTWQSSSSHVA